LENIYIQKLRLDEDLGGVFDPLKILELRVGGDLNIEFLI
jgi:hypothetical protein